MSIKLMSMAWECDLPTSEKMALLALCDYADDEGLNCSPSIPELMRRFSCGKRNVYWLLQKLESDGWITSVGKAPEIVRHYLVNVELMACQLKRNKTTERRAA